MNKYAEIMEQMDEYLSGTVGHERELRLRMYDLDDLTDFAGYMGASDLQIAKIYDVVIGIINELHK